MTFKQGNGSAPRVGVVLVQHDRSRYPHTLPRLFAALSGLTADPFYVVVDNAMSGDWEHQVSGSLVHIGGDNSAWEFSAFDRGIDWLSRRDEPPEVYILSTDALPAYGDTVLQLINDRILNVCRRRQACIGWVDSFMQTCRILDYCYEAWLRTSLLFLPAERIANLRPVAFPIEDELFFSNDPGQPFLSDAPLSENLQHLLREWLTTNPADAKVLAQGWHSQFRLDPSTLALFRGKSKAILREHLLSARLVALGAPCFDFRAIERASELDLLDEALGDTAWQWLGWTRAASVAVKAQGNSRSGWSAAISHLGAAVSSLAPRRGSGPTLVLPMLEDEAAIRQELEFFEKNVLPLVLQRFGDVRIEVDDGRKSISAPAVACLLPRKVSPVSSAIARAAAQGAPPIGCWSKEVGREPADGLHFLKADRSSEYAAACCRLIEEPELRAKLAYEAHRLTAES